MDAAVPNASDRFPFQAIRDAAWTAKEACKAVLFAKPHERLAKEQAARDQHKELQDQIHKRLHFGLPQKPGGYLQGQKEWEWDVQKVLSALAEASADHLNAVLRVSEGTFYGPLSQKAEEARAHVEAQTKAVNESTRLAGRVEEVLGRLHTLTSGCTWPDPAAGQEPPEREMELQSAPNDQGQSSAIPLCPGCQSPPAALDVDDVCPRCGGWRFHCGLARHIPLAPGAAHILQQVQSPWWERIPPSQVKKPAGAAKPTPPTTPGKLVDSLLSAATARQQKEAEAERAAAEKARRLGEHQALRQRLVDAFERAYRFTNEEREQGRKPCPEGFKRWAERFRELGAVLRECDTAIGGLGLVEKLRRVADRTAPAAMKFACAVVLLACEEQPAAVAAAMEKTNGDRQLRRFVLWLPFILDHLWEPYDLAPADPPDGTSEAEKKQAEAAFGWRELETVPRSAEGNATVRRAYARDAAGHVFWFDEERADVKRWSCSLPGRDGLAAFRSLYLVSGQWYSAQMQGALFPGQPPNYAEFVTREQARDGFLAAGVALPDELSDLRPRTEPTPLAAEPQHPQGGSQLTFRDLWAAVKGDGRLPLLPEQLPEEKPAFDWLLGYCQRVYGGGFSPQTMHRLAGELRTRLQLSDGDTESLNSLPLRKIVEALSAPPTVPATMPSEQLADIPPASRATDASDPNPPAPPDKTPDRPAAAAGTPPSAGVNSAGKENAAGHNRSLSGKAVEVLLGDEARKVLEIARSNESADTKMRMICGSDRRFLAWDSEQWSELLGVSSPAIRKTPFWREDRQRAIEADRELTDE
jgi:hypothetical protein